MRRRAGKVLSIIKNGKVVKSSRQGNYNSAGLTHRLVSLKLYFILSKFYNVIELFKSNYLKK